MSLASSATEQRPWRQRIVRWFRRTPRAQAITRWVAPTTIVAVVTLAIHYSPLTNPLTGVLGMTAVLLCAWFGGLGPALVMSPLLLAVSRFTRDGAERWAPIDAQELLAIVIITLLSAAAGLVGDYRRRLRYVTRQHSQKLQDQSRALAQAAIAFRDLSGKITEWSEGCERLLGWTKAEVVGQVLHDMLQTRFPESRAAAYEALLQSGQWRGELQKRAKDGRQIIVAAHWILYRDEDGQPIGVAEVLSDVTALRHAEMAVREADRRKDEFLAMLAHELRNPLAPIRTGLELVRMEQHDPQAIAKTCGVMERQMVQLVALVDDLLDVSRIARGTFELRKDHVALADVIRTALEEAQPAIAASGHVLHTQLLDEPLYVVADPHRLAQVLSNLLDNAAKYTPAGGTIRLVIERQGFTVRMLVTDNGAGIAPEMSARIFEMFTRTAEAGRGEAGGMGIGLALVKSIVELHGGQIEVRSEGLGRGSEFQVWLPIVAAAPLVTALEPSANGHAEKRTRQRVLIVDDNVAAATLLSMLVKKQGNEVCVAHDGLEAVAAAGRFRPHVVLMDLGMPKLDGYGAAEQIRCEPWGRDMLLVALTGWGQDGHKQRTHEAGFDHHLVKPADPEAIYRLLAEHQGAHALHRAT